MKVFFFVKYFIYADFYIFIILTNNIIFLCIYVTRVDISQRYRQVHLLIEDGRVMLMRMFLFSFCFLGDRHVSNQKETRFCFCFCEASGVYLTTFSIVQTHIMLFFSDVLPSGTPTFFIINLGNSLGIFSRIM